MLIRSSFQCFFILICSNKLDIVGLCIKDWHKVKNGGNVETKLLKVTSEEQYVTSEEKYVTSEEDVVTSKEFHWCQTNPEVIFQQPVF